MFRVMNADGLLLAQYQNQSEMHTWLDISLDRRKHKPANQTDANNFEVHNDKGELVYRVTGPKPADGKGLLDSL